MLPTVPQYYPEINVDNLPTLLRLSDNDRLYALPDYNTVVGVINSSPSIEDLSYIALQYCNTYANEYTAASKAWNNYLAAVADLNANNGIAAGSINNIARVVGIFDPTFASVATLEQVVTDNIKNLSDSQTIFAIQFANVEKAFKYARTYLLALDEIFRNDM